MLVEFTFEGTVDKVEIAVARLRQFEPPEGYFLAFSGGKDSVVLYDLARRAGVRFDAHYNLTTVDPPELVRFIRQQYPDVERHFPEKSMWELVAAHSLPPTRIIRYCCEELKENPRHSRYRFILTGIRWSESVRRRNRSMVEACQKDSTKRFLHPIIDWSETEVWEYIRTYGVPSCPLYDEGWKRLGCVMCPQQRRKLREDQAKRWPRIAAAWRRACERAFERRLARGDEMTWRNGQEMYEWWISDQKADDAGCSLFD